MPWELACAAAQPAALPLGEAAPDAEALVVGQRVLEALGADRALHADLLGLAGGAALLREERLRVGLGAERTLLPRLAVLLEPDAEQAGDALGAEALAGEALARRAVALGRHAVAVGALGRAHVIAQPRHLGHDGASPLALVPVRVPRDVPGPLCTR